MGSETYASRSILGVITNKNKINLVPKELKHLENYFEAYFDSRTNTLYYNLASDLNELMTRYLAKILIDHAKNVKFMLFFLELPGLTNPNSYKAKQNWKNIIEYASRLIPNVDKFIDNIEAEVAFDYNNPEHVNVIDLKNVKSNDTKFLEEMTDISSNAVKIISRIQSKAHYVYSFIYGSEFNDHLKNYIKYNNDTMDNDFHYMTDNCRNATKSMSQIINNKLDQVQFQKVHQDLSNQIINHFKKMEDDCSSKLTDIIYFYEQMENVVNILPDDYKNYSTQHINKTIYSKDYHRSIMKIVKDYNIQLSENVHLDLVQNLQILNFIEEELFIDRNFLSTLKKYFIKNKLWYAYLIGFYKKSIVSIKQNINLNKELDFHTKNSYDTKIKRKVIYTVKMLLEILHDREPTCFIDENNILKLTMLGNVLRTFDIPSAINNCENEHQLKLQQIMLFAIEKVFIDTDLIAIGDELQVVIISPVWEIVGKRKIILNGSSPEPHKDNKARDGNQNGNKNGVRGKAGLPGGPSGSFYGIGELFISGENLQIHANGGNGGDGQNGGDGAKGKKPRNFQETDNIPEKYMKRIFRLVENDKIYYQRSNISGKYSFGGRGGDGGIGGRGNKKGDVQLIGLKNPTGINVIARSGSDGLDGIGGKGENGPRGDETTLTFRIDENNVIYDKTIEKQYSTGEYSPKSPDGSNGTSTYKQRPLKEAKIPEEFPFIINKYKNFLITTFINEQQSLKKENLFNIYNLITSNKKVQNTYNIMALANELLLLEKQYFYFTIKNDTIPFYKILKESIHNYKNTSTEIQHYPFYKNIANNLEKIVLAKIHHINYFEKEDIIILNLKQQIMQYTSELNSIQNVTRFINNVNSLRNFKSKINSDIEYAQSKIDNEITEELEKLDDEADRNIESLITETIQLKKDAEKNGNELETKQAEIKKMMILKGMFEFWQLSTKVASLAGPEAEIIGGVVSSIQDTVKPYLFDDKEEKPKLVFIPKAVETSLKTITLINQGYVDSWISILKSHVDYVEQVKLDTQERSEIEELNKIIKLLKKIEMETASSYTWQNPFRNETNTMIKEKDELMRKYGYKTSISVLDRLIILSRAAFYNGESWAHTQTSDQAIEEVDEAINKTKTDLSQLDEYENNIYEFLIPVLDSLHNSTNLRNINIKNKNLHHLQWKILSNLETMQYNLVESINGFKIEKNINRVFKKIEKAFKTMIEIYKDIKNKNDTIDLATFITNTAVNDDSNSNFLYESFNKLKTIEPEIELYEQYNKLIYDYRQFVKSFKLFAFPCGDFYYQNLDLDLHSAMNLSSAVSIAQNVMNDIFEKISSQGVIASRKEDDFYVKPFFVWKYNDYREDIIQLLKGEKIKLNSTISMHSNYDAIKFREINLKLVAKDHKLKSNIEESMKQCDFRLTHSGKSYFRYNGEMYVINTESYEFYTNWRGITGSSKDENDFLFSPYTEWTLQIDKEESCNLDSYQDVELNLQLVGIGSYIPIGDARCQRGIENYFQKTNVQH